MKDMKKIIGERIRNERLKRNMSSEELASILNVSQSFIGLIERGQRGTNIKLLSDICDIFQITLDDIISDKKLKMCERKNDTYNDKISAINSLLRTLNVYELDFVISTIKNLYNMKVKSGGEKNPQNQKEYFY